MSNTNSVLRILYALLFLFALTLMSAFTHSFAQANADTKTATLEMLFSNLKRGQWAEADRVAQLLDQKNHRGSVHFKFSRSVQLAARNSCTRAAVLSQEIIAEAPLFRPAYDVLARCLLRDKRRSSASNLYKRLANHLQDGPERDAILARANSLSPDYSPSYSFEFDLLPSSNINKATSATNIGGLTITQASRQKPGVAISAYGKLTKPVFITDRLLSNVSLKLGGTYDSVSKDFFPSARIESRTRWLLDEKQSVYISPFFEQTLRNKKHFLRQFGMGVGFTRQHNSTTTFTIDASAVYLSFQKQSQNGIYAQTTLTHSKIISTKDKLKNSLKLASNFSKLKLYAYRSAIFSTEYEHLFDNGLIASFGGDVGIKKYSDTAAGLSEKRLNYSIIARIGISHRKLSYRSFRPELTYAYKRQWSNDVFHDYGSHDIGVRLKASF
ncbi:MAG: surface lipoprotein assembly modifier [Rhizobiaceae bacterium]